MTAKLVEVRRVSTKEQAGDERAGLLRQEAENAASAARAGAIIIKTFTIVDVSRPAMRVTAEWREIRRLIEAPDVHLVVDRLDRLVGDLEGMEILNECRATGTRILTSSGDFDLGTSAGRLVGAIQSLVAGDELATIRHRVQGAKEAKRRQGLFPGSAIALPTGIAFERVKGARSRWTFTPDIERVREVFRLVVHESVTNWADVGRRTRFSPRTVMNILRNPIYMGLWRIDKKRAPGRSPIREDGRRADRRKVSRPPAEIIEHHVYRPRGEVPERGDVREEAAVDLVTWEAAQSLMDRKSTGYYAQREPRGDTRFVYSGIVACADCGRPLMSRTRKAHGKRYDHYACERTQRAGERCATKYLRREVVNGALDRLFGELLTRDEFVASLVRAEQGGGQENFTKQIAAAKAKADSLTAKRAKLLDLYLDGDALSRPAYDAKRAALDADIARASKEVERLDRAQGLKAKATALGHLRELLAPLLEFEFLTPRQKRDLLRVTFPRALVSARGVEAVVLQLPRVVRLEGRDVSVPEHGEPLSLQIGLVWADLCRTSRSLAVRRAPKEL